MVIQLQISPGQEFLTTNLCPSLSSSVANKMKEATGALPVMMMLEALIAGLSMFLCSVSFIRGRPISCGLRLVLLFARNLNLKAVIVRQKERYAPASNSLIYLKVELSAYCFENINILFPLSQHI